MRAIARGDLKPGARLNEAQMAQTLGVSRGPVREAARELEGQGFLVSRPNQGFYVVDFDAQAIRDVYEAKDWLGDGFRRRSRAQPDNPRAARNTRRDRRARPLRPARFHPKSVRLPRPRHRAAQQPFPRRSDDGALPQILHRLARRRRRGRRGARRAHHRRAAPLLDGDGARRSAKRERGPARRHRLLARRSAPEQRPGERPET